MVASGEDIQATQIWDPQARCVQLVVYGCVIFLKQILMNMNCRTVAVNYIEILHYYFS